MVRDIEKVLVSIAFCLYEKTCLIFDLSEACQVKVSRMREIVDRMDVGEPEP